MADGGYCRALLYLLDHSISAELPELPGAWKFPALVSFGVMNLLLIFGQQLAHALSNRVRGFPLIARNVFQEGFNAFVHLGSSTTSRHTHVCGEAINLGHGRE
jgi:hypothetical protein